MINKFVRNIQPYKKKVQFNITKRANFAKMVVICSYASTVPVPIT